ncbi:NADH:flavin oxidoreductase [Limnoglobus roseus]|uniref:NADH:flavin oxidoreductase/NADH oxidase n=1 Tax=Limnoglobus roseus TaxID=2598579 RepID=A0A5C1A5B8_9BACT|nr:NADH:flavin oxidoreductase [Limnoglobus roseus]QEL13543.1 NADH:flavin oxidoreductase/NADH oxidase [Limnoglobus roseus]
MPEDILFTPLVMRNLTIPNRLVRSSISGRIDNYNGSGTLARLNFEKKFARGGVGAIISSHVPVHLEGRVLPNYATIDCDERIKFWAEVGKQVREASNGECKYVLQLSHSGRQQDIPGIENLNRHPRSATGQRDVFNGLRGVEMTVDQIQEMIQWFVAGAVRARAANLDGIELHSSNGYLFTQFLSSAINDRTDEYGGCLQNRARFLIEVIRAIRKAVGNDYFLMVKVGAEDLDNAGTFPLAWKQGNSLADAIQIAKWAEEAGADALHVSTGSSFPHPHNPAGPMPWKTLARTYQTVIASGEHTFRNFLAFRYPGLRWVVKQMWGRTQFFVKDGQAVAELIEGLNAESARQIKAAVQIPVLCTGGFQTAERIREVIRTNCCDAVTMARPLLANPDLPDMFRTGMNAAPKPCSYCNECLANVIEHPLGCYDLRRYDGNYEEMMHKVMSVFEDETPANMIALPMATPVPTQAARPSGMPLRESGLWTNVIAFKAIYNIVTSLVFFLLPFSGPAFNDIFFTSKALPRTYSQLFLLHAAVFGYGFWVVSRDITKNHLVIQLGVMAKLLLAGVILVHWWEGNITPYLLGPAAVDLLFALLFVIFLVRMSKFQLGCAK